MAEERITEVHSPSGETHTTHTTVISDEPRSRGGAGLWIALVLLIVVVVGAIWFFSGANQSEIAKDTAVAEAADEVGNAAGQVGDAARDVADTVTN